MMKGEMDFLLLLCDHRQITSLPRASKASAMRFQVGTKEWFEGTATGHLSSSSGSCQILRCPASAVLEWFTMLYNIFVVF